MLRKEPASSRAEVRSYFWLFSKKDSNSVIVATPFFTMKFFWVSKMESSKVTFFCFSLISLLPTRA